MELPVSVIIAKILAQNIEVKFFRLLPTTFCFGVDLQMMSSHVYQEINFKIPLNASILFTEVFNSLMN